MDLTRLSPSGGTLFQREPALVIGAIGALISLGIGFGLKVSPEQYALIMAAVEAVLFLIVRQSVFAPASVEPIPAEGDDAGEPVA